MTAVVIALFVAFLAGYLVRSDFAATERRDWDASRERWRARVLDLRDRLDRVQGQLDESVAADYLRDHLGPDMWLYDALAAVYAEVRPGERAENLTIQVRWKNTKDTVLIGIDRGEAAAERATVLHVTNGDQCWQETEDINLPDPDSPRWGTG